MKILVTNTVALNGGDAAILLAIIDLLKEAFGESVEITVYDSQPEIARRYYPTLEFRKLLYYSVTKMTQVKHLGKIGDYAVRSLNLLRFYLAAWSWKNRFYTVSKKLVNKEELEDLNRYSTADLVISTGGTYLVDGYSLWSRIFDYKITLLMQKPLVFFTQSLGPFSNKNDQKLLRGIFDASLFILLRDELSLKHLHAIGVKQPNLCVSSDVVFALAQEADLKNACYRAFPNNARLKIGISVRNWPHFKSVSNEAGMRNFQDAVRQTTQYLVEKLDADVTYISTCQGISEYWANDSEVAKEIVELIPENIRQHVKVDDRFHHPKELLNLLKSYDLVIATRMHMAILSLSAGTVVIPIAYEFKTKELFNRFGLGQWVHDIETVDAASLTSSIESFLKVIPEIQESLFKNVLKEREQAINSSLLVKQALQERFLRQKGISN